MKKFWKKTALWAALVLMTLVLVAPVAAQNRNVNLTFAWEQTITADFHGWKLWYSTTSGGPYQQFGTEIVYDGSPAPEYTATEVLTAPDGAETTFYFVINAWDSSGNYSADSNEVSYRADFLPPGIPVKFTVTVAPSP